MLLMKVIDLQNKRFGRWLVLNKVESTKGGLARWLCICDCGTQKIVIGSNLLRGMTTSCGCYNKEKAKERLQTHGKTNTRIYRIWQDMKHRCNYKNNDNFYWYGNKGIKVCKEWELDFLRFYEWSINNGYEENLTLDRINAEEDYCPDNCRWVNITAQQNNRKDNIRIEYHGKNQTLSEWSKELGINRITLWNRLFTSKWSVEKAFTTKVNKETHNGKNKNSAESLESQKIFGGRE